MLKTTGMLKVNSPPLKNHYFSTRVGKNNSIAKTRVYATVHRQTFARCERERGTREEIREIMPLSERVSTKTNESLEIEEKGKKKNKIK